MAVNLLEPSELLPVPGLRLGSAAAAIKSPGRLDVALYELPPGARMAATFTRNAFCAAPVIVARRHREQGPPRYLLVNSGNANAGTGAQGLADALSCCRAVAARGGCEPNQVLPFSTGVIGQPLPVGRIVAALPAAFEALRPDGWFDAARAMMTTDTVLKGVSRRFTLNERTATITGIAKGAGMIRPDMATMLAFLATDVPVAPAVLQHCLQEAVAVSFNRITVDGDTSTNDACVLVATGAAATGSVDSVDGPAYRALADAVTEVCTVLAGAIVRDGEGATKFISVQVREAASVAEAEAVAYAIAHSPLVKTAFFASDPNWGRILAAVGRAGVPGLDVARVTIDLGAVRIVAGGGVAPGYTEARGQAAMAESEIPVRVALGRGDSAATVWTCDFSYDYVRINAEYRT